MFQLGDTFIGSGEIHGANHLWIIINDPVQHDGHALYVNLTTVKGRFAELTCVLQPGDHPFVKHASYLRFADARMALATELENAERLNLIRMHSPASTALIQRIRQAAAASPLLAPALKALL